LAAGRLQRRALLVEGLAFGRDAGISDQQGRGFLMSDPARNLPRANRRGNPYSATVAGFRSSASEALVRRDNSFADTHEPERPPWRTTNEERAAPELAFFGLSVRHQNQRSREPPLFGGFLLEQFAHNFHKVFAKARLVVAWPYDVYFKRDAGPKGTFHEVERLHAACREWVDDRNAYS